MPAPAVVVLEATDVDRLARSNDLDVAVDRARREAVDDDFKQFLVSAPDLDDLDINRDDERARHVEFT